ncbi:MAG: hypothetical protein NVS9B15_25590 [Acidobacteriaceae bacterium]
MQLIEVSAIGVRASIVRLTKKEVGLVWLLFPMVHLGPREYYVEVERRMHSCDVVLAEGIDSKIVEAITMAYRAADGSARLGTIVQPPLQTRPAGPVVVNTDISGPEFENAWGQLPLPVRIGIPLIAPLYGFWIRNFARPEDIHEKLETYDLPSRTQLDAEARSPELFDLLLGRRDAHLLEQIDQVHDRYRDETMTVGIAYGAAHMPSVVHHLCGKLGYIASSAEWVTVFDYTRD